MQYSPNKDHQHLKSLQKVMDIKSRLPGCDGQAAIAVSAYTQVKMDDAHKLLKIPKSECPDIWTRLPRHRWPKSWSSIQDPIVPLNVICIWSSLTAFCLLPLPPCLPSLSVVLSLLSLHCLPLLSLPCSSFPSHLAFPLSPSPPP